AGCWAVCFRGKRTRCLARRRVQDEAGGAVHGPPQSWRWGGYWLRREGLKLPPIRLKPTGLPLCYARTRPRAPYLVGWTPPVNGTAVDRPGRSGETGQLRGEGGKGRFR